MSTQSPSVLHGLNEVAMLMHDSAVVFTAGTAVPELFEPDRRFYGTGGDQEQVTILAPHTVLSHG